MEQQVRLPWGEPKPADKPEGSRPAPARRQVRARRPWELDERTRRAARKGIEEARRALAETQRSPADAA
jgi:hypothetical protein